MADIFISYTKSDRAKAQTLASAFEREGWSVWWDPKIPPGQTFDEVIDQALAEAKCVIVLWSVESANSRWVKTEASEGNRRGVLVPGLIEDDVTIPLEFRYQHASRLTDWRGQPDHTEFSAMKAVVGRLLSTRVTPQGIYSDAKSGLMWSIADNGQDINWPEAARYARRLRLGGYSDWRLPSVEELETLCEPAPPDSGEKFQIQTRFHLTGYWLWSSRGHFPGIGYGLYVDNVRRSERRGWNAANLTDGARALCVRDSS